MTLPGLAGPPVLDRDASTDPSMVGHQTRWALGRINGDKPGAGPDTASRFVPAFLAKHPGGLDPLFEGWRARGPYEVLSYSGVWHKSFVAVRAADGGRHVFTLTIDSTGLIRLIGLLPETATTPLTSWAELDEKLAPEGVTGTAFVARVAGEPEARTLEPLHELNPDLPMPAGSAYKVFLLRAVAAAIEAGTLRWDDTVTLRPELRSLPTGDTQDLPDGTVLAVRETAHKMFSLSDNTAGDLLQDRIGRDAVERAVVASGHHDPSLLAPFLASRETYQIGWGDAELLRAWTETATSADPQAARRAVLDGIRDPITARVSDMTSPVHHLGVDWYASARDVGTALAALWDDAAREPSLTISHILTSNLGMPIDPGAWPRATFKGGSSPGFIMFCWLVEDPHGTAYVVVIEQRADDPTLARDARLLLTVGQSVIHHLLPGVAGR